MRVMLVLYICSFCVDAGGILVMGNSVSPNGKYEATIYEHGTEVVNVESGNVLRTISYHIDCICLSNDLLFLSIWRKQKYATYIAIFAYTKNNEQVSWFKLPFEVHQMAFFSDVLLCVGRNGEHTIRYSDKEICTYKVPKDTYSSVSFNWPSAVCFNDQYVAIGNRASDVYIWSRETKKCLTVWTDLRVAKSNMGHVGEIPTFMFRVDKLQIKRKSVFVISNINDDLNSGLFEIKLE